MKLVDLSICVENTPSEPMQITINRLGWYKGAKRFCRNVMWNKHLPIKNRIKQLVSYILGKRRLTPNDFPDAAFLTLDVVTLPTHMGTHIDAPIHYGPSEHSVSSKTVDQLPLKWFYQPAVKLDLRHKKGGDYITVEDIKQQLTSIGYQLQPYDIVIIWTGVDKLWGTKKYFTDAPGMSREATAWLVNQGIKVIGIDTYGFDRPFATMLESYWKTNDTGHLWPAHFYGREKEYIQIERLTNLDKLPNIGFKLICFPLNIKGLDASWVRAVAVFD